MDNSNYERVLKKVAETSKISPEEIEGRVKAKIDKLSGLISKDGAIQIIAAELGVSFDEEKLKIADLLPGMRKAHVSGSVIFMFPIRTFKNKDGETSKVANFIIADETANVKVVLWDTHHIDLLENEEIGIGSSIELFNGSFREGEIHLSSFSELKKTEESFGELVKEKKVKEKQIADFHIGELVKSRAIIVQVFDPRFFKVCPECKKKVSFNEGAFSCIEHNKVNPETRGIVNLVLDDGTGTIRAVFFGDVIKKLGEGELQEGGDFSSFKNKLLGKEMFFKGNIKNNKFFGDPEIIINEVEEINLDELIKELEQSN